MDNEINPASIIKGLQARNLELSSKNDEYKVLAENYANARKDFNVKYASTVLKLKGDYPATLIPKLASGDPIVSDLEFKMYVAEAIQRACLERMKDLREAIGTYRSLLTWLREEMGQR